MRLIDMHIHAWGTKPDPDHLIQKMTEAGVWGGLRHILSAQNSRLFQRVFL